MERDELLKKIKSIASDKLSISEDQVTEEASFIDDLGADSLDTVELVMALEDEFKELQAAGVLTGKGSVSVTWVEESRSI